MRANGWLRAVDGLRSSDSNASLSRPRRSALGVRAEPVHGGGAGLPRTHGTRYRAPTPRPLSAHGDAPRTAASFSTRLRMPMLRLCARGGLVDSDCCTGARADSPALALLSAACQQMRQRHRSTGHAGADRSPAAVQLEPRPDERVVPVGVPLRGGRQRRPHPQLARPPGRRYGASGQWHRWTQDNEITGVSCPSNTLCVAVDYAGNVLHLYGPAPRGRRRNWHVDRVRGASELESSVLCPSRSLCVAVGSGHINRHERPRRSRSTEPRAAHTHGRWVVKRIDTNHRARHYNSHGLLRRLLPVGEPCVSPPTQKKARHLHDPRRGPSSDMGQEPALLPRELRQPPPGVSCPSSSFCDVGGIYTSTDPRAGAHASGDPPQRRGTRRRGPGVVRLSRAVRRPSARRGDRDPDDAGRARGGARWSLLGVDEERYLTALPSCVATLCVAVDRNGRIITSTDPGAAGRSSLVLSDIDGFNYLSDVACTSPWLSVAVDHDGTVLTSTRPLGGAGTWRPERRRHEAPQVGVLRGAFALRGRRRRRLRRRLDRPGRRRLGPLVGRASRRRAEAHRCVVPRTPSVSPWTKRETSSPPPTRRTARAPNGRCASRPAAAATTKAYGDRVPQRVALRRRRLAR